jgi:hypothetical protein
MFDFAEPMITTRTAVAKSEKTAALAFQHQIFQLEETMVRKRQEEQAQKKGK